MSREIAMIPLPFGRSVGSPVLLGGNHGLELAARADRLLEGVRRRHLVRMVQDAGGSIREAMLLDHRRAGNCVGRRNWRRRATIAVERGHCGCGGRRSLVMIALGGGDCGRQ